MTIPDRLTFKRKEVIKLAKLDGKVLDFWEREFGGFRMMINTNGDEFYSRQDVETILKIKQWLIVERKSKEDIKKELLVDMGQGEEVPVEHDLEQIPGTVFQGKLKIIRKSLQEILTILDKNDIN